ncbi:MAG: potassium channel family protein, partial [Saprospiraceae bacterium]|nr:potassium channel family protein [Saprospiraceae bacterium]
MRRTIFRNNRWKLHKVPSTLLSIRAGIGLLIADLLIGVVGFMIIEGYDFGDAIYMTIITVSTVGYTEVKPISSAGQYFTSVYILVNLGIFSYLLAVFSYYIVQGEIFKRMHESFIKSSIETLEGHVILCGYGKYGREIVTHLAKHDIPYVIIEKDDKKIEEIQKSKEKILYLHEDATHDEALLGAGIERAKALIASLPDDSENLFTVLSARQLNANINIISRSKDPKSERKLELAGANHVIMTEQIGGFYIATLVSKPGAVEFFYFITDEYHSDVGFEEVRFEDLPQHCRGKSIREMKIRSVT